MTRQATGFGTMRVVDLPSPGGPEAMTIGTAPVPSPGPGEVLIRVEAAGVNRPDLMQRAGKYPPPDGASPVLGLEVAGEVVALGPADGSQHEGPATGSRVTALVNGGGYAEYCVAPAGQCLRLPDGYDAVRAAALPENLFTVWSNVFAPLSRTGGALAERERFLVHGGSSGIGLSAIQLARHVRQASVFTTAGDERKCEAARQAGATLAVNYREQDFVEAVMGATGGKGVDVILDMVGGSYAARNIACLGRDGRLVMIATQEGRRADGIDLLSIISRRLVITGSTLRPRSTAEKAWIASELRREVWPLLDRGVIAPVIEAVFRLDQVVDAHRLMEAGGHVGKIILSLG